MRLRAAINPLLLRRGGRDTKKKFPFQCGADGVVAHRNIIGERPPRLRHFGSFAPFVYWRSLPSSRGGEYSLLQPELGAATIYFVMFTIVILGFLVMATDVGRMYLIQGELQTAADAAALASATRLTGTLNATTDAGDQVTASLDSTTGNVNHVLPITVAKMPSRGVRIDATCCQPWVAGSYTSTSLKSRGSSPPKT